jgi:mannose/fructose/N-acetylgalactosamine-specific phosphotransferase system component IID
MLQGWHPIGTLLSVLTWYTKSKLTLEGIIMVTFFKIIVNIVLMFVIAFVVACGWTLGSRFISNNAEKIESGAGNLFNAAKDKVADMRKKDDAVETVTA